MVQFYIISQTVRTTLATHVTDYCNDTASLFSIKGFSPLRALQELLVLECNIVYNKKYNIVYNKGSKTCLVTRQKSYNGSKHHSQN